MRVEVIPIKELPKSMKQRWLDVQASNPVLSGPCFHPELFESVGRYCPDIYVAILRKGTEISGFLPFRKDEMTSTANPIDFCDYEAIIGPPHQRWDLNKVLRKSDLNGWDFSSLVNSENIRSRTGSQKTVSSPRIDLSEGLDSYLCQLKQKKISYNNLMNKRRILERDIGPVRFVPISSDIKPLYQLLAWKSIRYNSCPAWVKFATELLEYIYYSKESSFSGILSALYAGDNIIAATFCFRSQGMLHLSVNAFNPDYSKYSPGLIILNHLISELDTLQCKIFDLAPGGELYKLNFSNSSLPIMTGSFRVASLKDKIKSINWLYQGIRPLVQVRRKIRTKLRNREDSL